jgi:hypothetical protein
MDCRVCGTADPDKPQIFRGEDWCCDHHRKIIQCEVVPTLAELRTMDQALYNGLIRRAEDEADAGMVFE